MSIATLWKDMYMDAVRRERVVQDRLHAQRMHLIAAESHRLGLLSLLRLAAITLTESSPELSRLLLDRVAEIEATYEPQEILSAKTVCEIGRLEKSLPRSEESTRRAPVHTEAGSTVAAPF